MSFVSRTRAGTFFLSTPEKNDGSCRLEACFARNYSSGVSCAYSLLLRPPQSCPSPPVPWLWSFVPCDGLDGASGLFVVVVAGYTLASPAPPLAPSHPLYLSVIFTLTNRVSTIPSNNIRGCQSSSSSTRGLLAGQENNRGWISAKLQHKHKNIISKAKVIKGKETDRNKKGNARKGRVGCRDAQETHSIQQ